MFETAIWVTFPLQGLFCLLQQMWDGQLQAIKDLYEQLGIKVAVLFLSQSSSPSTHGAGPGFEPGTQSYKASRASRETKAKSFTKAKDDAVTLHSSHFSLRGKSNALNLWTRPWAYGKGGHGLPKVSFGPAMPYSFTPCGRATPERGILLAGQPVSCNLRPSSIPLDASRHTPMVDAPTLVAMTLSAEAFNVHLNRD
jgi:hypothetical protein